MPVQQNSFAFFVYPFRFDERKLPERIRRVDESGEQERRTWEAVDQPAPPGYTLCHVEEFFNRGSAGTGIERGLPAIRFWRLTETASRRFGFHQSWRWRLCMPRKREMAFRLGEANRGAGHFSAMLILCGAGIGLVAVHAVPESDEPSAWIEFLHYFRFADKRGGVGIAAEHRAGGPEWIPDFPEPARGSQARTNSIGTLKEIIDALLLTAGTEDHRWWRDVSAPGWLLPYHGMFVAGVPQPQQKDMFQRIRRGFHAGQTFDPEDAGYAEQTLRYDIGQWFHAKLSAAGFVAFDAPDTPFYRDTLPQHLRTIYFFAFVLAVLQRFTLISISTKIAACWQNEKSPARAGSRAKLRLALRALHQFTASLYFSHVFHGDNHQRFYKLLHQTFGVPELFNEVTAETNEMHQTQMEHQADLLQRRVSIISTIAIASSMWFGFWGINWKYLSEEGLFLYDSLHLQWIFGSLVVTIAIAALLWLALTRGQE